MISDVAKGKNYNVGEYENDRRIFMLTQRPKSAGYDPDECIANEQNYEK
jgi:hypothetical protein